MNLRAVDLNLLVVLDALLDEAHVSRAANRVSLSQPAMSNALERCRHLFKDPLLERSNGRMQLTARGEALREPVKNLLIEIGLLFAPPQVDLHSIKQTVRILLPDLPGAVLLTPLQKELAQSVPGLNVVIQPWLGALAALESLAKGNIDLAVSVFPDVEASFRRVELLVEHYRVVMRRSHPAAEGFDLGQWLAYPHVLVSGRGDTRGTLDEVLAERGMQRRIGMVVPSFLVVPSLLDDSDLIAMLPSRCIPADDASPLVSFEPPLAVPGFPLHLAWHRRRDNDPAVQHVAVLIQQILKRPAPGTTR